MVETRKPRWPWPFAACFALRGDLRTFAGTCTRVTNGHEYSVARTTAEIYSERWCRQLAHPPPRRINFISTALSCPPFLQIRCLTLLKFRKTTKSLYKDWSLCTIILILENKILEDRCTEKKEKKIEEEKKKYFICFLSSHLPLHRIVSEISLKSIKIDRLRLLEKSNNCWKSKNFSPSLRLKSNPWKVFGQHSRTAAECRSCRLTNGRGNGILKAGLQQMFEPGTGKKAAHEFRGFDKSAACVSTVYCLLSWIQRSFPLLRYRVHAQIARFIPSLPPRTHEKLGGVGFRERDEIERYALLFLLFFLLFFFFFLFSFLRALA